MNAQIASPEEYLEQLSPERQEALIQLRQTILDNLPEGFAEVIDRGMPAYVVPHALYPAGYHCNPAQPLPFIAIAAQKNYLALYHMGLYTDAGLLEWFKKAYAEQVPGKLDMGKSCIRFKKMAHIPFELIGELIRRVSVQDWIAHYEAQLKK
ncbi:MAG: DUF1801 domain-containing protein [Microscillaceae bacterium]|nr:DUF1801 domain-containing protein [Microscillaceae bacterium]